MKYDITLFFANGSTLKFPDSLDLSFPYAGVVEFTSKDGLKHYTTMPCLVIKRKA